MKIFILIMIIYTERDVAIKTVEFNSMETCQIAKKALTGNQPWSGRKHMVCVKK